MDEEPDGQDSGPELIRTLTVVQEDEDATAADHSSAAASETASMMSPGSQPQMSPGAFERHLASLTATLNIHLDAAALEEGAEQKQKQAEESEVNPLRIIRRKESRMKQAARTRHSELIKREKETSVFRRDFESMLHAKPSQPSLRKQIEEGSREVSYFVPSLTDLCARKIADIFETLPSFAEFPDHLKALVIPNVSLDMPLEFVLPTIEDEKFWKRYAFHRHTAGELDVHSRTFSSFKQRVLEKAVQDILEQQSPVDPQLIFASVKSCVHSCGHLVRRLHIRQLLSHLDPRHLVALFPNLVELSISYGVRTEGMDFDMAMHGIRQTDSLGLSDILRRHPKLRILQLSQCMLDDMTLRGVLSGMVGNTSLQVLDLSHNRIGDNGAQALATLLASNFSIQEVSLANNNLGPVSGQLLSLCLSRNRTVRALELRLNRLGDEGGRALADGLLQNSTLTQLGLGSTGIGFETASMIRNVLRSRLCVLTSIDLSNNPLGPDSGALVCEAVAQNPRIVQCDLRLSGLTPADLEATEQLLRRRNSRVATHVHHHVEV